MNNENKNILDELENTMMEEIRHYAKADVVSQTRYNKTDRMVKAANVVLAIENLKERQYMNRTNRRETIRKTQSLKSNEEQQNDK